MSNTKWTPGDWSIAEGSAGFVYALNDHGTNRFWLNVQSAGEGSASAEEVKANARLIAAAPELYESLETLVRHAERQGRSAAFYDRARAALAKARGES